jgi:HTH-type transcriptional regulator / antitoxin HigA
MVEMVVKTATFDPVRYGRLCAKALPRVIANDEEFDRLCAELEVLDRKDKPTPEEDVLAELLGKLIEDYDSRAHALPDLPPFEMIRFLMEQRGITQPELTPVFGSRGIASEVLNGKREPSKAHIRRLAEFFHVSPELFL